MNTSFKHRIARYLWWLLIERMPVWTFIIGYIAGRYDGH
jgi:hypothetical protein